MFFKLVLVLLLAQVNPLDPPPNDANGGAANPLDPPAAAVGGANLLQPGQGLQQGMPQAAFDVPAFVVPGARFTYEVFNTSAKTATADGTASQILRHVDVVAVLPDRVICNITNYEPNTPGQGYITFTSQAFVITKDSWTTAIPPWKPLADLNALTTGGSVQVVQEQVPLNGQTYNAKIVIIRNQDSVSKTAYDTGTGLVLWHALGTGPFRQGQAQNDGLNRQHQTSIQFKGYRVRQLPWANSPPPPWAQQVRTMAYQGIQTSTSAPGIQVPIQMEAAFTERGQTWTIGTGKVVVGSPETGGAQPPTQSSFVTGNNMVGSYWMSPQWLQQAQPGVIDQDPVLGHTISYRRQFAQGTEVGVITRSDVGNAQSISWAYDLGDGALVQYRNEIGALGLAIELQLVGRQ